MKSGMVTRAGALAVALSLAGAAEAQDCANRWGVSRTLEVSASTGPVGLISYRATLPLEPREVVLTFDDGPMPRRTPAALDALREECAKATFFVVGSMASAYPALLRQTADEGHTIATHSWSHAYLNRLRSAQGRLDQINGGLLAAKAALGEDASALSPFFRFPGLGRTAALDRHLAEHGLISMSADIVGDDWRRISPQQVIDRVMSRLEQRGSGVILLHDIQPRTIAALPELLRRLREGGWKLVHIKPRAQETQLALAAAERPKNRRMIAAIEILAVKVAAAPAAGVKASAPESAAPAVAHTGFQQVASRSAPGFAELGLRR